MSGVPDQTAVLASLPTEAEAVLLVQTLDAHGISAQLVGALTSGFRAEAPGQVKVLVRVADLAEAKSILQELHSRR